MQLYGSRLLFAATDLSQFLACPHLALLSRRTALGGPKPVPYDDPGIEVIRELGRQHEAACLAALGAGGDRHIAHLGGAEAPGREDGRFERRAAETLEAMRAGADVIYQGTLLVGDWLGYPDFLVKVPRPSRLGDWSYEVVDAKLSREAKAGALLQVLLYADLLAEVQGVAPDRVHLALGGPRKPVEPFAVRDYAAYFRALRQRFLAHVANPPGELPTAVEPVSHCDLCVWSRACNRERREADHLSFVAGISRHERRSLVAAGIPTLEALASLPAGRLPPVAGIKPPLLSRLHRQARLQLLGREQHRPLHELLPPERPGEGLSGLPVPSPGDLFFDLEGDPHAFEGGIEYLFGVADAGGAYQGRWSFTRAEERATFEWFIDLVIRRLEQYPDLHVYHYAPYEPGALKRLAGRYDTRVDELDRLLRGRVFVDLYRVVRQGVRASVESYSIKKLEEFYGFEREMDLRNAGAALANFEAWLELGGGGAGGAALLDPIEGYNRDDCLSTLRLRDWLEGLRPALAEQTGGEVGRPPPPEDENPEALSPRLQEVRELMARLLAGVPEAAERRSPEEQGRWLAAQLLEYHRREAKSTWWRYFDRLQMSDEQLIEDSESLGGLEYVGVVGSVKQSDIHRYRFPPQEYGLRPGREARDRVTRKGAGTIVALDDVARTIDLRRGKRSTVPHPRSLIPYDHVSDEVMRDRLLGLGRAVADHGLAPGAPYQSAIDLLLAHPPRAGEGEGSPLIRDGESAADAAIRLALALDRSVLPIQGPPGAGKTWTGARMILALLAAGRKVGVTATSHKVISNLLHEVCRAAGKSGRTVTGIQKAEEDDWCGLQEVARTGDNAEVLAALQEGDVRLAAGTAWLWSRPELVGAVDVLFIDEAGQFSLANALAVAPAAASLVLLGDPRQLQQPQQGLHPPGTDLSALDHLLQGEATMPAGRGLFLDRTWRLHPAICAFTSEYFYQSRLHAQDGLERQRVGPGGPLAGSGLRWRHTPHTGNGSESPEEVQAVAAIVRSLVGKGMTWTDREGVERPLALADVLVVAPYNDHVAAIREALPEGARVGTVDKFQGQEAPVVIYSLASSSAADAPRGMEFLYNPNRLNVATSRARCLVILVSTEQVFFPECRTPQQMRLANGLCRYLELAPAVG